MGAFHRRGGGGGVVVVGVVNDAICNSKIRYTCVRTRRIDRILQKPSVYIGR